MSLASLSEWFPAKIMEEGCWADIFLASRLVVDDPCSSTIYSFECVDVFNFVGVPNTGTVLHFGLTSVVYARALVDRGQCLKFLAMR